MVLRDLAILVAPALISELLPNGALEEALAPFAAYGSIMTTCNTRIRNGGYSIFVEISIGVVVTACCSRITGICK